MTAKINVITSFSEEGWKDYAQKMVNSAAEHWGPTLHLTAFYHDFDLLSCNPVKSPNITYRNLNEITDMLEFRESHKRYDGTLGGDMPYNWKHDCIKFSHKVFALTEFAFELCADSKKPGWLVWLDADTTTDRRFTIEDMESCLPAKAELVYLGRQSFEYSETSFVGFNLNHRPAVDLLGDLRGQYISGEVLNYREWHDGFIFERLLIIYNAHGMKSHDWTGHIKDIKSMTKGKQAFDQAPIGKFMTHFKGKKKKLYKDKHSEDMVMPAKRYQQLLDAVLFYKPKTIVETGAFNGQRAIQLSLAAFEHTDYVSYIGYDLFEDATSELDEIEFNSKDHNTLQVVRKRLEEFAEKIKKKGKTFTFRLIKGDTKETLQHPIIIDTPEGERTLHPNQADLAFIDGGHSDATVQHDYATLKDVRIIILDDFINPMEEKKEEALHYCAVNRLYDTIENKRKWVLPSADPIYAESTQIGSTHLAIVLNDDSEETTPPPPQHLFQVPIIVQPKDCVPKEYIQNNIQSNTQMINKWVGRAKRNNEVAIMVSGGASTNWKELEAVIQHEGEENCKIVCVKHSYPDLLKHGFKPWACVILDPRPVTGTSTHGIVRSTLFENVHEDTTFMLASMTDPSVTELVKSKTDKVIGWHAFSEALRTPDQQGKQPRDNKLIVKEELGMEEGATLIVGGTCAAMRGIGIMHTLGFRYFHLFGYDCCFEEPTEELQELKDDQGKPKYIKVSVDHTPYWTTGELLAMAQDCEKLFARDDIDMDINFHGENTLVASLWKTSPIQKLKHYTEVIGG
ncbi:MAG: hypothetical protein CMI54_08420 [Parcubacteria group bacterium]|nr:hypothetical protein [Parcubacteria group bacterium]